MTNQNNFEDQLRLIGCNFRFWGRPELKELANILSPSEVINNCVNGSYEGGFALLCVTDQRVLLIDKKPMYLTIEDIRFDMITQLDYSYRLLNSTLLIHTPNKFLRFTAYNQHRLRQFYSYVQNRVTEIRQYYMQLAQGDQSVPYVPHSHPVAYGNIVAQTGTQIQANAVTPELQVSDEFGPSYFAENNQFHAQPQQLVGVGPPVPPQPSSVNMPRGMSAPIISAYTRLPLMSRQRRFLGSRAMNTPIPSMYNQR